MVWFSYISQVMAVISLGCYEGGITKGQARNSYLDFFESAVVIGGIIALIILIITIIDKPAALVGRAFMVGSSFTYK